MEDVVSVTMFEVPAPSMVLSRVEVAQWPCLPLWTLAPTDAESSNIWTLRPQTTQRLPESDIHERAYGCCSLFLIGSELEAGSSEI